MVENNAQFIYSMQRFTLYNRLISNLRLALAFHATTLKTTLKPIIYTPMTARPSNIFTLFIAIGLPVLSLTQTACIFDKKELQVSVVTIDSIGNSRGELGYVSSDRKVYLLNPAGGGSRQVPQCSDAERLRFRGDRNQVTYVKMNAFPTVQNLNSQIRQDLNGLEYHDPLSFEYTGDLLYFLSPTTHRVASTDAAFNTAINNRINTLLSGSTETLLYLSISPSKDLVLVLKSSLTNSYRIIWNTEVGSTKSYTSAIELKQPRFSNSGTLLTIPASDGIFTWNSTDILPKKVIFNTNIRTFAINPTGTEIAYITNTVSNNDTIYVHNLLSIKGHRKLPTIKNQGILDIDWK